MAFSIRKHFGFKEAFLLLVGVFVLFAILRFVEIDAAKTIATLKSTPLQFLFVFIFVRVSMYLVGNYKWAILVEKIKKTAFSILLPIYMAGFILDNLIPGPGFGAEPIKAYYLGKAIKKDAAKCFASALMDNILLAIGMAVLLAFSALYMYFFIKIFVIRIAVIVMLCAFLLVGITALYFRLRQDQRETAVDRFLMFIYNLKILSFLKRKYHTFEKFKDAFNIGIGNLTGAVKNLWGDRKLMYYGLFLTFVIAGLGYLGHYVLLLGYGISVNVYALVAVITIVDLLGYYSFIPGGTGIIEGGRITTLAFIGGPPEIAAAVTIIDRLAFYIATYGIGYVSLLYVNLKYVR